MESKISISFFVILVCCSIAIAQTENEKEAARKAYTEGAVHYANGVSDKSRNYKELEAARNRFYESLELWRHSKTAYFLSIVYAEQRGISKAKKYAELALKAKPQLEQKYVDSANKVIAWANSYIKKKKSPAKGRIGVRVSPMSVFRPLSGHVVPSSEL